MIKELVKNRIVIGTMRKLFPLDPNNRYVNLGGGNWYYPRWENIDLKADDLFVDYRMNLDKEHKLPFKDETVKIVFTHNLVYLLSKNSNKLLFKECYRILKKGGIFHIGVADDDKPIGKKVFSEGTYMQTRFNYFILNRMLLEAGFSEVERVEYRQSREKVLRGRLFDRVPDRTVYVEGRK